MDNSFVNAVKNLNIPYYENYDSLTENINDATLKPIVKCRNHSSILVTASEYESTANFSFNFISKEAVHAEKYLISRKLVKTIKTNDNFFAEAIFYHFNKSLENGKFSNCLKLANITPLFLKSALTSKNNYRPVSILSVFQRHLKVYSANNF